jgi:ATP-dependent RNA helicase HelY
VTGTSSRGPSGGTQGKHRAPPGRAAQAFLNQLPFAPDPFQLDAIAAIESGVSVVVTAPTGSGKTLVAEAAVHLALAGSQRAFYTAPIKALSNQKYADFREVYGSERVGLLTGDNVINGDAPLVVMTTEVLRNMIYADSSALQRLGVVVLDEVHYLQDRYRGSVWEEIIIHLPRDVQLVNLSATVANGREFTEWVASRRGGTELVSETVRPVPLTSMYLLKDRHRENKLTMLPLFDRTGTHANGQLVKLLRKGRGRYRRFVGPRRLEVAGTLAAEGLLPAIYFIFSRAGCEQAAGAVAAAGLGLTSPDERSEIRRRAEAATEHVAVADLGVLGYSAWADQLERGVAAHHAGMIPAFKEAVEDLFAAGLIKVVFATETLSLGLNMPAKAVVLERLSKFTGESHETLQPGDYTQLTGRAGRRGIDASGTAVVIHDGRLPIERVAAIAAEGSHPLRSSFQPSYNMAVNLIANYPRERAEELLAASFAQFRVEHRRQALEERIATRRADVQEFVARAECDRGDVWDYIEAEGGKAGDHLIAMRDFVQRSRSGDVFRMTDDPADLWALMARGWGGNPRLLLMSAGGEVRRVSAEDLPASVAIVGTIELPEPVRTRDRAYRSAVGRILSAWEPEVGGTVSAFLDSSPDNPVATCPDLPDHLSWARRVERVEREIVRLERRLERGGGQLVERFRAIERLLADWGYVAGWSLTPEGEQLRFVYNELDLLLTESIRRGAFEGLVAADLAAAASFFTFEPRAADAEHSIPTAAAASAADVIAAAWRELAEAERERGLPETRPPETGFAALAHGWASGHDLDDLFEDEFAAGDFVRNCRQLLDLLRQLRDAFGMLREPAAEAIGMLDRGIVAAGGRL